MQIAEITGAEKVFRDLRQVQKKIAAVQNDDQRERLITRLLYLRVKLAQCIETASLEVNSVKAAVELDISRVDDARARIVEHRARVLKRNSIINFVSGGVTKMVGYSIAMADINMPSNVLEVVDGGIQSSLSGLAMKEQEEEKHFTQTVPSLLNTVILGNNDETHDYPGGVWRYLESKVFGNEAIISGDAQLGGAGNSDAGASSETRRERLLAAWKRSGMLARPDAKGSSGGTRARMGMGKSVSAQLLEDRAAMLSDLKSVVAHMNNSLMQLSQYAKESYKDDPDLGQIN